MKKGLFVLLSYVLINLMVMVNVEAADPVFSLGACTNSNTVSINETIECDVNLTYDGISINTVNFTIVPQTSLSMTFVKGTGWENNTGATSTNISIYNATPVSGKIGTLRISTSTVATTGVKTIGLNSISITNSGDEGVSYTGNNISREITVVDNRSNNTNLASLKIDGVSITGFTATKSLYNDIATNKEKVTITATAADSKATVTGTGQKTLVKGTNEPIIIKVKAENGSEKEYQIIFNYTPMSSDNNLKTLNLYHDEEKLEFSYDAKIVTYNVEVSNSTDILTVESSLNHEKASYVKDYGNRDIKLEYGINKIEIKVKAENGSIKTYTLNITRKDERGIDATLSKLIINNKEIILTNDVYEYKTSVRYVFARTEIVATPNETSAKVEFADIDLEYGDNVVPIKVTAENGTVKEYKITITRLTEEVSKVTLKNIEIKGYELLFNVNKTEYDLNIQNDDTKLEISITPTEDIKVEILGNENLKNDSTIIVRITDDDGLKNYTFNIHKTSDKILGFLTINMLCYIIFGFGCLMFVLSIIYCIRKNKK